MSNRSYLPFPFGGLFCLLTLVACFDSEPPANAYRGPIIDAYLADPTVINDDGTYYLYATGYTKDGRGVPIYRSTNLTDWTYLGGAVPRGDSTAWNHENFWAPEVFPYAGRYYLYFTASPGTTPKNTGNRVGVAVADTPAGPFSLHGVLVPEASLDSHVYRDDDGQLYLYYVAEHGNARGLTAGRIYVDSLLSPTEVVGNPREVVGHLGWQEGPFLVREGANYLLTYSSGGWKGPKYHLRYGRADNPLGPFTESLEERIRPGISV
ncbi:MAG: family 43 glycosylhydrolase, partial [Bacteroidota bacterium]